MRQLPITTTKYVWTSKLPLFVGDTHGRYQKLVRLLLKAGFKWKDGKLVSDVYELFSVGDLVDRGPENYKMLKMKIEHAVLGNHDWKVLRWLAGRDIQATHGTEVTVEELKNISDEDREEFIQYYLTLPLQMVINEKYLMVHGAMRDSHFNAPFKKAQNSNLYGLPTGSLAEDGTPIRSEWWLDYTLPYKCIYGHTPVDEPFVYGNTINIDTGCGMDRTLTAYDPENNIFYQEA